MDDPSEDGECLPLKTQWALPMGWDFPFRPARQAHGPRKTGMGWPNANPYSNMTKMMG